MLIFTLLIYIHRWESSLALAAESSWHLSALLKSAHSALLPASLIAFVVLILAIQRRPGKALFSFLAVWLSFGGVFLILTLLLAPHTGLVQGPEEPVMLDQRIHNYKAGALYLEEGEGSPVGIILTPGESPRMQAGRIESRGFREIGVDAAQLRQEPQNPFFNEVLQGTWILAPIFKEIGRIEGTFALLRDSSSRAFLMVLAGFSLLISTLWIFGRFTEWPLLNTVFLLFAVRIVLLLLSLILSPGAQELADSFFPGLRIIDQLWLILGGGGLLLILWDLLFVPYRRSDGGRR